MTKISSLLFDKLHRFIIAQIVNYIYFKIITEEKCQAPKATGDIQKC